MKLETFIDHHMDKDVSDIIFVDQKGNEIIVPGDQYDKVEVLNYIYEKIIRLYVTLPN